MPENPTQQTQETPELQLNNPAVEGDEEEKTGAALEQAITERESRITGLEKALSEAQRQSEASAAEIASLKEAGDQAVSKYLAMAKALNPTIPEGIIGGETIEEIDQSVEKSKAIVEAVKQALKSEAAAASIPAGAPPSRQLRGTESLSPREKIAYAIQQRT